MRLIVQILTCVAKYDGGIGSQALWLVESNKIDEFRLFVRFKDIVILLVV